jgi:hypothetical protein
MAKPLASAAVTALLQEQTPFCRRSGRGRTAGHEFKEVYVCPSTSASGVLPERHRHHRESERDQGDGQAGPEVLAEAEADAELSGLLGDDQVGDASG